MSNAGTLHRIPARPWRWLPWLVASQLAVILVWALAGWHWGLPLMVASHALFMVPVFLPNSRFYAPVLSRLPEAGNTVWLTIDDGPGPETRALLDLLDRHQARATFFLVGERALAQPELVAEILRRGYGKRCACMGSLRPNFKRRCISCAANSPVSAMSMCG